jgi:hypothetical protein
MEQHIMERATDGSESNRRNDEWCERWIMEQKKERWVLQAMDQTAIEGAIVAASN